MHALGPGSMQIARMLS